MTHKRLAGEERTKFDEFMAKPTETPTQFQDKMRLFIIYILCCPDISDVQKIVEKLRGIHGGELDEHLIHAAIKRREVGK